MRRFLTAALLASPVALAVAPAHAQYFGGTSSRCTQDYFGNVSCTASNGTNLRIINDMLGGNRAVYTDGWGRQLICRTTPDYLGGYRTSCY